MTRRWVIWALIAYTVAVGLVLLLPVRYGDIVLAITAAARAALGGAEFGAGWIEFSSNVLLFLPLGLLMTLLFRRPWVGAAAAMCLSIGAELVQIVLPNRMPSLRDIVANAIGALLGALIAWLIIRRLPHEPPPETTRAR